MKDRDRRRKKRQDEAVRRSRRLEQRNLDAAQIGNDNSNVVSEIPKLTSLTEFVSQDDVNKAVKYQKRVSIDVVEVHRVHHELVSCDSENEFTQGSSEQVVKRNSDNCIESYTVSETAKPPGTVHRNSRTTSDRVATSLFQKRPSLEGRIPKRWQ